MGITEKAIWILKHPGWVFEEIAGFFPPVEFLVLGVFFGIFGTAVVGLIFFEERVKPVWIYLQEKMFGWLLFYRVRIEIVVIIGFSVFFAGMIVILALVPAYRAGDVLLAYLLVSALIATTAIFIRTFPPQRW